MNLELTLSSLQDKGYRLTRVRTEIVKIFSFSAKPLSANEIEEKLLRVEVPVNKATIYRELQFLLTNGYIIEVYLHPSEVSYESAELKHHHHLVCDTCGSVDNVTNCLANELEADIYKKKGFKIKRHTLELYGTCSNCVRKTQ
jgi:Fe2+ or Zn2+ uptake regulation protein